MQFLEFIFIAHAFETFYGIWHAYLIRKWLIQDNCAPAFLASCGTTHCSIHQVRKGADAHLGDHQIPDMDLKPKAWHPLTFGILR